MGLRRWVHAKLERVCTREVAKMHRTAWRRPWWFGWASWLEFRLRRRPRA